MYIDHHIKQVGKVLTCTDSSGKIVVNKYDNKTSRIIFDLDGTIPGKLYFALLNPTTKKYFLTPINNNEIEITSAISIYPGLWSAIIIGADVNYEIIDNNIDQTKLTYISDEFKKIVVRDNFLNELNIEESQSPANLFDFLSEAQGYVVLSKRYAVGDEKVEGSDVDNAKYYMNETKKLLNNFEGTVKDTVVEVVENQMDILGNEIERVDSELNQALSETNQSVEELNDELYHFKINTEERIKTLEERDIDVDITVDSELNPESENPIQNKVVTKALDNVTKDVADVKSDLEKKADSIELERVASEVETLKENEVTAEDIANLGFWKEEDGKNYIDSETSKSVNIALEEAKASGEFDGAEGPQGPKGDTGEQGPRGETGATGAKGDKGDKGDTGASGKDGKDGTSVTVSSVSESNDDGGSNVVTFSDGKTMTIKNGSKGSTGAKGEKGDRGEKGETGSSGAKGADGYTPQKNVDYFDGKDGVSVTHKWNGTTLTVTSASGTSSADLKGDKGDTGATGKTAYEYAQDGGYTGTETAFAEKLAQNTYSKTEVDTKFTQVNTALDDLETDVTNVKSDLEKKQPVGNYALKSEIPSVPVKSVNDKTGVVVLSADDVGATTQAYVDSKITDVKALLNQLTLNVAEGETLSEALAWLETDGDATQAYILPDNFIYARMKTEKVVESGGGYTNALDGTTKYINQRWSHSGKKYSSATGYLATEKLPVTADQTVYVNLPEKPFLGNYARIHYFDASGNYVSAFDSAAGTTKKITTDANGVSSFVVGYENTTDGDASTNTRLSNADTITHMVIVFNLSLHVNGDSNIEITDAHANDVIVSIGNPIEESKTEIVIEYAWANTGHSFIPANYDKEIADLKTITTAHGIDIAELKEAIENGTSGTEIDALELIKNWDAPIYDANIPVFQLSSEKTAMTNATNTPDNIYAMYDALMAKHPRYITKTDLGLCSDGVNHVYRYDFREPEPHHESNKEWSETKAKAIIITGIHFEWAGIYAMYNALEEIAENPELRNFRRNTHLIVVPVANPYATIIGNYQSGLSTPNSYGVRNANGVEIHRNFEVDFLYPDDAGYVAEGGTHHGGTEPLSEVETQYIDDIMKNNADASLFLSCHNCGVDTTWGTGFIWSSTATKYMCNMGYRLVDKMSDAWMDKYSEILESGIAEYKTDALADNDTRFGWAGLSTSPGTEAKQATKYGIQGTNVEICDPFQIHGTKANPELSMSSFTLSRGAEVYANFLLTALGTYDHKDKALYT